MLEKGENGRKRRGKRGGREREGMLLGTENCFTLTSLSLKWDRY